VAACAVRLADALRSGAAPAAAGAALLATQLLLAAEVAGDAWEEGGWGVGGQAGRQAAESQYAGVFGKLGPLWRDPVHDVYGS
jgi:hypothetical protein